MQDQQPVAFHTGSLFVLFDKQGVSLHPANSEISSYSIPHGAWALSGSWCGGKETNRPCIAFDHIQRPGIHVIHTGSAPRWARQEYAVVYDMDVWSLEELESLMYVISLSLLSAAILLPDLFSNLTSSPVQPSTENLGRIPESSSTFSLTRTWRSSGSGCTAKRSLSGRRNPP